MNLIERGALDGAHHSQGRICFFDWNRRMKVVRKNCREEAAGEAVPGVDSSPPRFAAHKSRDGRVEWWGHPRRGRRKEGLEIGKNEFGQFELGQLTLVGAASAARSHFASAAAISVVLVEESIAAARVGMMLVGTGGAGRFVEWIECRGGVGQFWLDVVAIWAGSGRRGGSGGLGAGGGRGGGGGRGTGIGLARGPLLAANPAATLRSAGTECPHRGIHFIACRALLPVLRCQMPPSREEGAGQLCQ